LFFFFLFIALGYLLLISSFKELRLGVRKMGGVKKGAQLTLPILLSPRILSEEKILSNLFW
jgi:hypothetical protein